MSFKSWHKAFTTISLSVFILLSLLSASQAEVLAYWSMDDPNYPDGYFDTVVRATKDSSGNGNTGALMEYLISWEPALIKTYMQKLQVTKATTPVVPI